MAYGKLLLILTAARYAASLPADKTQAALEEAIALITPAPTPVVLGGSPVARRGVISDITSELDSYADSLYSGLGSAVSYITDGILPNFAALPTGSNVLSSANVSSSDLDALPTQVLNIPGYANWTNNTWNMRFHGNVYKQPDLSNETVDKLADFFLIDTSVANLTSSEADQARNVTREIFVVQQADVNVTMNVIPGSSNGGDGEPGGSGATPANVGQQIIQLPYETTPEGDFDVFVPIENTSGALQPGTGNIRPQKVNVYAEGTDTGNATSYLVSDEGFTVVSDIDDILRVTKIYAPKQGIFNTFAAPFTPWLNMPDIYRNWSESIPTAHFHYLTTTPEQITRNYEQFIYDNYPGGSFDDRPLNFSDVSATLSIRKFLLEKVFQTFPQRKFILVADTSNSDVMRDYPAMAHEYPGQVQCIFLRNTTATDSEDKFPYNTKGFQGLNESSYMFFLVPDDLKGLDIEGGQCRNMSIQQNITYGYQGLPDGINLGSGDSESNSSSSSSSSSSSGSGSSNNAAVGAHSAGMGGTFGLVVLLAAMFAFV